MLLLDRMSSKNNNKVKRKNDALVLREEHEQVMAEKQKELDKVMELLAVTKTALELEKHARAEEQAEMVGKDIDPTLGKISDVTEMTGVARIEQLQLNNGRKANLNAYVHDVLFSHVKFLSDESFTASPKILEEAMLSMGIQEEWDKLQHSEDTKKEIRIALTHRRSYIKGQVFKKYKGGYNLTASSNIVFFNTNITAGICLSRNNAGWYLTSEQKNSSSPGLTFEDIDLFRVENFSDAPCDLQEKWYMVMFDLLPCICKQKYKDNRETELASTVATVSDEALLLWWIALNSEKWNKLLETNDHDEPVNEPPTKRSRKQQGAHDSTAHINLFYEINNRTSAARRDPITGEGWDRALMVEAKRRHGKGNKSHKGNKAATSVRQATYVLCYSGPDQEPRLERKDAPVPYEV